MTKPNSIRTLPVRWEADRAFIVPVKRRKMLSWLGSRSVSAPRDRWIDVVGQPIWENGETQTNRSARLDRSEGPFRNNMPVKGEEL